jgi:hypothetical protein
MVLKDEIRTIVKYMLDKGTDNDVIENYVDTLALISDVYTSQVLDEVMESIKKEINTNK